MKRVHTSPPEKDKHPFLEDNTEETEESFKEGESKEMDDELPDAHVSHRSRKRKIESDESEADGPKKKDEKKKEEGPKKEKKKKKEKKQKKVPKKLPPPNLSSEEDVEAGPQDFSIRDLLSMRPQRGISKTLVARIQAMTDIPPLTQCPEARRRMVLCQENESIVAYCYDPGFPFERKDTISLSNFGFTNGRININNKAQVRMAQRIKLTTAQKKAAQRKLMEPINAYVPIPQLKLAPMKKGDNTLYYSLDGVVVEDHPPKKVPVRGQMVDVREIEVYGDRDVMTVSLWGQAIHKKIKVGQRILIQDGSVQLKERNCCNVFRNGFFDNMFVYPAEVFNEEIAIQSMRTTKKVGLLDVTVKVNGKQEPRLIAMPLLTRHMPRGQECSLRDMCRFLPFKGHSLTKGLTILKLEDVTMHTPVEESESEPSQTTAESSQD